MSETVLIPVEVLVQSLTAHEPFERFASSLDVQGRANYEIIDSQIWLEAYRKAREARVALSEALQAARAAAATALQVPPALTPDLRDALGLMVFETGPLAHLFRATGAEIPRKIEGEQAFILHWLLTLVQQHGSDWRRHASDEMERRRALLKPATPEPDQEPLAATNRFSQPMTFFAPAGEVAVDVDYQVDGPDDAPEVTILSVRTVSDAQPYTPSDLERARLQRELARMHRILPSEPGSV